MTRSRIESNEEAGFSLIELIIAVGVTLAVMTMASSFLAGSFRVRSREDQRSQAIADVQRALNIMTREIANGGYRIPTGLTYAAAGGAVAVPKNGIISTDSSATSIRVLANISDTGTASPDALNGESEDVLFSLYENGTYKLISRQDNNIAAANHPRTVLANRIDSLNIRYFNQKVDYTTNTDCTITVPSAATTEVNVTNATTAPTIRYLVVSVCVLLPQVGTPGSDGYQPASRVQLVSDVVLRNADLNKY